MHVYINAVSSRSVEPSSRIHQELDKLQVTSIWGSQNLSVEILDEPVSTNSSIAMNKHTLYTLVI